jgi:hypothetical protein
MTFLVSDDGMFECRKSEQGENAGNGVFCVNDVKAGTILPYYGITIKDEDDTKEAKLDKANYRTYVIAADYTTKFGNQRTARGLSVDGDPRLPQMKTLETFKTLACRTNEAKKGCLPNCLLACNPNISRADIKRSLLKKIPIPVSYIVVIENLPRGTELLTCYGDEYGEREYDPCKLNRRQSRQLVDKAYRYLDAL